MSIVVIISPLRLAGEPGLSHATLGEVALRSGIRLVLPGEITMSFVKPNKLVQLLGGLEHFALHIGNYNPK